MWLQHEIKLYMHYSKVEYIVGILRPQWKVVIWLKARTHCRFQTSRSLQKPHALCSCISRYPGATGKLISFPSWELLCTTNIHPTNAKISRPWRIVTYEICFFDDRHTTSLSDLSIYASISLPLLHEWMLNAWWLMYGRLWHWPRPVGIGVHYRTGKLRFVWKHTL